MHYANDIDNASNKPEIARAEEIKTIVEVASQHWDVGHDDGRREGASSQTIVAHILCIAPGIGVSDRGMTNEQHQKNDTQANGEKSVIHFWTGTESVNLRVLLLPLCIGFELPVLEEVHIKVGQHRASSDSE